MARRLFTLSALSLLLCAAAVVLWAVSYVAPGGAGRRTWRIGGRPTVGITEVGFASARGRVAFGTLSREVPGGITTGETRQAVQWVWGRGALVDFIRYREWYGPLGFEFSRTRGGPGGSGWTVMVPYWALCLLTAIPPAYRLARIGRRRRQERLRLGLCPRCGYDLRATPGRCPECGTAVAGKDA